MAVAGAMLLYADERIRRSDDQRTIRTVGESRGACRRSTVTAIRCTHRSPRRAILAASGFSTAVGPVRHALLPPDTHRIGATMTFRLPRRVTQSGARVRPGRWLLGV